MAPTDVIRLLRRQEDEREAGLEEEAGKQRRLILSMERIKASKTTILETFRKTPVRRRRKKRMIEEPVELVSLMGVAWRRLYSANHLFVFHFLVHYVHNKHITNAHTPILCCIVFLIFCISSYYYSLFHFTVLYYSS